MKTLTSRLIVSLLGAVPLPVYPQAVPSGAGQAPPVTANPMTSRTAAQAVLAPSGSPAAPPGDAPDRRRENKALVRRYLLEVMSAGRLDRLDQLVAKTYADRSPGAPAGRGPEVVRRARRDLSDRFEKIEYSPQELVAEGDRVVARYVVIATPRRSEGQPARPVVVNGITFFKIAGGRIAEAYIMNDDLNLMRQLGYSLQPPGTPSPGASSAAPPALPEPPSPLS